MFSTIVFVARISISEKTAKILALNFFSFNLKWKNAGFENHLSKVFLRKKILCQYRIIIFFVTFSTKITALTEKQHTG